jgi:hypothetical protein
MLLRCVYAFLLEEVIRVHESDFFNGRLVMMTDCLIL